MLLVAVGVFALGAGVALRAWWEFTTSSSLEDGAGAPLPVSVADCGTGDAVTFMGGGVEAVPDTVKAWECFTDHLSACSPATLETTLQLPVGGVPYRIAGATGDGGCTVSGAKVDFGSGEVKPAICGLSQKLIRFSYGESERRYPGKKFMQGFTTVGIITGGGGEVRYPDGTTETVTCAVQ